MLISKPSARVGTALRAVRRRGSSEMVKNSRLDRPGAEVRIRLEDPGEADSLLDAEAYKQVLAEQ